MKVIVIGDSTAGMTAASKLKRMLKNDIEIIYDQKAKIIVGSQIFDYNKASLKINALIPIIWTKTKIGEIEYLDLPYSPPFAKSVDVLNVALIKINK